MIFESACTRSQWELSVSAVNTDTSMSQAQFSLPETQVSKDLIERVQFSVSSRNAASKVSECITHVFVSPYCDDPSAIAWQYVSSGVACLLRKKELSKNGRKLMSTIHVCLYNATYGVLVWKGAVAPNSCYTAASDNFHVYVMHELNAIVGLLFEESSQAREFLRSYMQWDADKIKEERAKGGTASQFRKEMISKPCNFQHIQGTQALDECMEIERIKTDIQAAFFGLGPARPRIEPAAQSRSKGERSGGKRKKDVGRPRIKFQNISVPCKLSTSKSDHMLVHGSKSFDVDVVSSMPPGSFLRTQESVPVGLGRHSMSPAHVVLHRSQPDLLNSDQLDDYPSPLPLSPQYDSLHQYRKGQGSPQLPPVSNHSQGLSGESQSPQSDTLPMNGIAPRTAEIAPLQNGADPIFDGLIPRKRAEPTAEPVYDSLQTKTHTRPTTDQQKLVYTPQLYVDAIMDSEVAGYNAHVTGQDRRDALDYSPPARLSPLDFEKEFSQAAFFHPAFVTSTTNC